MDNLIATLDVAKSKIRIFQCAFLDKEVMQELILIQICKIHKPIGKLWEYATRKLIKFITTNSILTFIYEERKNLFYQQQQKCNKNV